MTATHDECKPTEDSAIDEHTPPRPRRAVLLWAGGAALLCALTAFLVMPTAPEMHHESGDPELATTVAELLPQDAAVGVSAAVIDGNEVTQATLGTTDGAAPVRTDTAFETGSVQKTLTATLLADMVRTGEVHLDTTLAEIWTDLDFTADNVAEITLEQLATHHAGLPPMHNDAGNLAAVSLHNLLGTDPYRWLADPVEAVAARSDGAPEDEAEYTYSNLGYATLGQSLAQVAGEDYPTVLTDRVLEPLGMNDTTLLDTPEVPANGAAPHRNPTLGVQPSFNPANAPAGLGTWTTTEDMVTLVQTAMAEEDPALAAAQEPRVRGTPDSPYEEHIGLAWIQWTIDDTEVTWHNGGTAGSRSFVAHTGDDRAVVVLANSARVPVETIGLQLLDPDMPEFEGSSTIPLPATVLAHVLAVAAPFAVLLRMARRRVTSWTPPLDQVGAVSTLLLGSASWALSLRVGDPDLIPAFWALGAGALGAAAVLGVWRWPKLPHARGARPWHRWVDLGVNMAIVAATAAGILLATR